MAPDIVCNDHRHNHHHHHHHHHLFYNNKGCCHKHINANRPRFSLSRTLFRKNVWAPHLGWHLAVAPLFFLEKKLATFFRHHDCLSAVSSAGSPLFQFSWKTGDLFWSSLSLLFISLVHSGVAHYFRHVAMLQKICCSSFGGPFFVGARVQWNMLNMHKSAAECIPNSATSEHHQYR